MFFNALDALLLILGVTSLFSFVNGYRIADANLLQLVGRFDTTTPEHPISEWPGSQINFAVKIQDSSPLVTVSFLTSDSTFDMFIEVKIDGNTFKTFEISNVVGTTISFSIDDTVSSIHYVSLTKRTESKYSSAVGHMQLGEIDVEGGILVPIESKPKSKVLFVGDSVTVGYGVDGTAPCTFSPSTEDVLHSFAGISATDLNVDFHAIGWSGKGAVRNYGDSNQVSIDPMPLYYNRTLASDPSLSLYWDPLNWQADVVFVMLGTNDYSTDPVPSDTQFINGLTSLLQVITRDYPSAKVIAACSPHQRLNQCKNIEISASNVGASYLNIDANVYNAGYGCDNHPNQATSVNIAAIVTPAIRSLLPSV